MYIFLLYALLRCTFFLKRTTYNVKRIKKWKVK